MYLRFDLIGGLVEKELIQEQLLAQTQMRNINPSEFPSQTRQLKRAQRRCFAKSVNFIPQRERFPLG